MLLGKKMKTAAKFLVILLKRLIHDTIIQRRLTTTKKFL